MIWLYRGDLAGARLHGGHAGRHLYNLRRPITSIGLRPGHEPQRMAVKPHEYFSQVAAENARTAVERPGDLRLAINAIMTLDGFFGSAAPVRTVPSSSTPTRTTPGIPYDTSASPIERQHEGSLPAGPDKKYHLDVEGTWPRYPRDPRRDSPDQHRARETEAPLVVTGRAHCLNLKSASCCHTCFHDRFRAIRINIPRGRRNAIAAQTRRG
jgi:hypothetical protein